MVVECPLDILMRYFYRVQDRAWRMPYPLALDWIWRHDEAERTAWVDRYRNSHETLGEVIKQCFITREAMWEIPLPVSRPPALMQTKFLEPPRSAGPRSLQAAEPGSHPRVQMHPMQGPSAMDRTSAEASTPAIAKGRPVLTRTSASRSSMVAACAAASMQPRTTVETPRPPRSRARGAGPRGRLRDLPLHWTFSQAGTLQ